MLTLNLDPNFKPVAGEEIAFESFIFSGGEPHIKINPNYNFKEGVIVTQRLKSFNDLGLLCVAVDALQRLEANLESLFIPYFPAARQDRVMIPGEPLTVKVYANIINHFNFKRVLIYDAHSEVTPALLNNVVVINNHTFIKKVVQAIKEKVVLVSPDGGALKKIYKVATFLEGIEVIECSKSRDVKSGKLTGFKVYADDLKGATCLIVDDICDGGGTFIGLAEALKKCGAGKLYLAVSHGIFSHGIVNFRHIEKIFTTDAYQDLDWELVSQIKLGELI
jgi:ribose-phosphate pyrophosphokinase